MTNRFILSIVGMGVLGGCATPTVQSTKLEPTSIGEGVTYYLPKQLYNVTFSQNEDCSLGLAIAKGELVADKSHRYSLQPIQSHLRSDSFKFTTGSNGLLSATQFTNTGVGETIILNIVKSAAAVAPFDGGSPVSETCDKVSVINAIDPALPADRDAVDTLAVATGRYIDWDTSLNTSVDAPPAKKKGIYYRRSLPYRMSLSCLEGAPIDCTPQVLSLSLPQASPVSVLAPLGAPFATNTDKFSFSDGMLTGAESARKSELIAITSIPLTAAKAILEVPKELLTLRTQKVTAENTLNTQEQILLNQSLMNEKARLEAEKNATEAQKLLDQKERELEVEKLNRKILEQCLELAGDDAVKIRACVQ
mgnify:CR=1 FL=1